MSFKKDGEVKVFKPKDNLGKKYASEEDGERYTVDNLITDAEAEEIKEELEKKDVSN